MPVTIRQELLKVRNTLILLFSVRKRTLYIYTIELKMADFSFTLHLYIYIVYYSGLFISNVHKDLIDLKTLLIRHRINLHTFQGGTTSNPNLESLVIAT